MGGFSIHLPNNNLRPLSCTMIFMDLGSIISLIQGWVFVLIIFGLSLGYVMLRGRQRMTNLILGLYLSLLLYKMFPYTDFIADKVSSTSTETTIWLIIFVIFTILTTWLFSRLMPREYLEGPFESIIKKFILAISATILLLILMLHYLPIDNIVSINTPIPTNLLTSENAFIWLSAPLISLFIF